MWNPITLTTPLTRGEHVRNAQYLLKHNRFKTDFMPEGGIDGIFGQITAEAVRRAKFELGYPQRAIIEVFGDRLEKYLRTQNYKTLPLEYKLRRRSRLKYEMTHPGIAAIDLAKSQVGYHAPLVGGQRYSKYGVWYGFPYSPYCAEFLSWCFYFSGYKYFHYAYVPYVELSAELRHNNLTLVGAGEVVQGNLATYDFTGQGIAQHIEFFDKWEEQGVTFWAVGGNTGNHVGDSQDNGGWVERNLRYTNQVRKYIRVN